MRPFFAALLPVLLVLTSTTARAQEAPGSARDWAPRLGLRALTTEARFPVLDQLVLVPDAATYYDELARWSPEGRWPVLIEDDHFAPLFVRAFRPGTIVRRASVGAIDRRPASRRALLDSIVVRAWGGDPTQVDVRDHFDRIGHAPPGVVITSTRDGAHLAAVALAAGRGQPLAWLDDRYGRVDGVLDPETTLQLIAKVDELVLQQNYERSVLGDTIDTITVCRNLPARVEGVRAGADSPTRYAVTDVLGRRRDGSRYAIAGWIFGDGTRSAYVAMCSLFLQRERIRFVNTYQTGGDWNAYAMSRAAVEMKRLGYEVMATNEQGATKWSWLRALPGGWDADVVCVSTRGQDNAFQTFDDQALSSTDVPIMHGPAAVHFMHSWSMKRPAAASTIAARWLSRGAYLYVGASHEPFAGAFVPPDQYGARWAGGVPMIPAARHYSGDFAPVWKINTFGDPLLTFIPPRPRPERVAAAPPPGDNVLDLARAAMTRANAGDAAAFGEAAHLLRLLGRDDLVIQMWRAATQQGLQSEAAVRTSRAALGPLFRARDIDEFMRAYDVLPTRDETARDMLWHLVWPTIAIDGFAAGERRAVNEPRLIALSTSLRTHFEAVDLERLRLPLTVMFGEAHFRGCVEREMDRTESPRTRQALRDVLDGKPVIRGRGGRR